MSGYQCKYCKSSFDEKNKLAGHTTWCELNPKKDNNLLNLNENRSELSALLKEDYEKECKWCKQILRLTRSKYLNHVRWCKDNPNRDFYKKNFSRPLTQESIKKISAAIVEAHKRGAYIESNLKKIGKPRQKHTEETKKNISDKRKAYLATSRDKCSWSRYNNKESVPEKKFREFAERSNLKLKQYYIPPESDRFFEIDFANIENKIAFEINGNQHYNKDGLLKPYYKQRQDYFINLGWRVVEIHYSLSFKEDLLESIVRLTFSNLQLCQEKIQEISNSRLERKRTKEQNKLVLKEAKKKSLSAFNLSKRKAIRPSKEELLKLLWELPTLQIAKIYNVSDKAIEKWAKSYEIPKPPRGYWAKKKAES